MRNKHIFTAAFVSLFIIGTVTATMLFGSGREQGDQLKCTDGIAPYPIDQITCLHLKETEEAQSENFAKTEAALPQPTNTVMTEEELAVATRFVPGVPDVMRTPEVLSSQEFADGPVYLRGSNSIWRIGAIEGSDPYGYTIVYVLARYNQERKEASISIAPYSQSLTQDELNRVAKFWIVQDTEPIDIIGFENLEVTSESIKGTLFYRSTSGNTGRIDLAAESTESLPGTAIVNTAIPTLQAP